MSNQDSKNKIPHIVHYCWFGGNDKPKDIEYYINGWKNKMSNYEFIEWNESNFDIENSIPYVKEAYLARKFAFVSDYVRIMALSKFGGVYFDTDIEVVRNFDELLVGRELVMGFESDLSLETAFIACTPENPYIVEFLDTYENRHFINADGSFDMSVINEHFSKLMETHGVDLCDENMRTIMNGTIAIYPRDYFAAFDIKNWHIKPTENTYTIHHMNASWSSTKKKIYFSTILFLQKVLGYKGYDKLKMFYDRIKK